MDTITLSDKPAAAEQETTATKSQVIINNYLQSVLKDIMAILKAECGSVFIFDDEKKELILNAFYNSHELNIISSRQKIGEGISGKVAGMKKPVLVKNIDDDARFQHNGFKHYRTNSFMSIPLISPRGLLGIMNISDKSNHEPFSDKDFSFVVMLCRYACIIADNLASSERLKEEKESFRTEKNLLEKYATVGKLAAGIVHEVNNPLDGIIRYTNMLLMRSNLDQVAHEYLSEIKKGLNRIAKTTKSLLAFSHQVNSTGKVKSYISINELIHDSLDVFNSKIAVHGIQLNVSLNDKLPKVTDLGISHVFVNIIKNAIDSMPEGGKLEITSDLSQAGAIIKFKDSGKGIPVEILSRIFEPFFTTKSIINGTGLGLAISREIVGRYGGKIEVSSQPEKGSEFTVFIPKENLENA